jgi:hypothetical protein
VIVAAVIGGLVLAFVWGVVAGARLAKAGRL